MGHPVRIGEVDTARSRTGSRRHLAFTAWAAILSLFFGVLFTGVTLLTLTLWYADPGYAETNPVVDLGFFALGVVLIGSGFAVQLRTPERHVSGLQQALIGLAALAVAGLIGERIEPLVGALLFLLAASILVVLHPARHELLRRGARTSLLLGVAALAGAVPAGIYAAGMLTLARAAGPSCFLGECARGDRFAEMAALAVAVILVCGLAGVGTPGWRVSAWCAGAAAAIVGLASVALPQVAGSLGTPGGALAVAWGVLVMAAAERERRQPAIPAITGSEPE